MNVSSPPFRSCQSDYTRSHFKEIKKIRHEGFKYCSAFCVKKIMSLIYPRRRTQLTIHLLASHYYPMFWWRCKPNFRIMSDFRKSSTVSVKSRTIFEADDIDC